MNNIFAPKYDSGRKFEGTFGLLKDPPPSCEFCTDAADIYYLRGYSCTKCFEKHIKARESYLNTLTLKEKIAFYKWQGWFVPMKWKELTAE